MGPGAAVHVVRIHHRPGVVDDDDLGVHVDRSTDRVLQDLRVAQVSAVVGAAEGQVDATYEGDVASTLGPAHDQLLVVRATATRPRVEGHLGAGVAQGPDDVGVGLLTLLERLRVGPPDQAGDGHSPLRCGGQDLRDGGALTGQQLLAVGAKGREVDLVAVRQSGKMVVEATEVGRAVNQWLDPVADREGPDGGCRVAPLLGGQNQPDSAWPVVAVSVVAVSVVAVSLVTVSAGRASFTRWPARARGRRRQLQEGRP